MDDLWEARRRQLQGALIKAALELAGHMSAAGFTVPVPGTTPAMVVELREVRAGEFDIEEGEG